MSSKHKPYKHARPPERPDLYPHWVELLGGGAWFAWTRRGTVWHYVADSIDLDDDPGMLDRFLAMPVYRSRFDDEGETDDDGH